MSSGSWILESEVGSEELYCNKRWSHGVISSTDTKFELFFILFLCYSSVVKQLSYLLHCNYSRAQHISRGPLIHSIALRHIHIRYRHSHAHPQNTNPHQLNFLVY